MIEPTVETYAQELVANLRAQANPHNLAGMARYGINPERALGISVKTLRGLAREARRQFKDPAQRHTLAASLWDSGIHEARILASIVDEPARVTEAQMEAWAAEFNSWDLTDQVCSNLFDKTLYGYAKALEWSDRPEEFVRRAGFTLMAAIASHAKNMPDPSFEPFLNAILKQSTDDRNFVKKAVNWALRGIGKRSPALHRRAVEIAHQVAQIPAPSARWIARDALREWARKAKEESGLP